MSDHDMNLTLKVWRQRDAEAEGCFEICEARDISPDMSFLEMLDVAVELERLAARLEKVADAASRDFTSLFFSQRKGRPTVPRARGAGKSTS